MRSPITLDILATPPTPMAPEQADLQNPYDRVTIRRREVGKLADHDRLPLPGLLTVIQRFHR